MFLGVAGTSPSANPGPPQHLVHHSHPPPKLLSPSVQACCRLPGSFPTSKPPSSEPSPPYPPSPDPLQSPQAVLGDYFLQSEAPFLSPAMFGLSPTAAELTSTRTGSSPTTHLSSNKRDVSRLSGSPPSPASTPSPASLPPTHDLARKIDSPSTQTSTPQAISATPCTWGR
ncbi:vegetative cell wall protein gp1-like [Corylus avellana]|uniref:vegetative cell wall protein gp1-like n=1 Tax=Corylus avellana TaxID=13451 RepID=UPI00286C4100|nr:vegetative cell wall protein gp1-like [Corylus avellana]